MSSRRATSAMGGFMRQKLGCIMTFETAEGKRLVLHRAGMPILEGVKQMCAEALGLDPSFRVVSYSSPDTTLADITGGRADRRSGVKESEKGVAREVDCPVVLPEVAVLSRAGLRHLLHPRLEHRRSAALMRQ